MNRQAGATPTRQPTTTRSTLEGAELLYVRGVLREADLRDEQAARNLDRQSKRQRLDLTPEQASSCPLLASHLAQSGGWPPSITRSYSARLRHLNALYAAHGTLVMLRRDLQQLDQWPLRSPELPTAARPFIERFADKLLLAKPSYVTDIQRGGLGGTHSHMVTPLACIKPKYAAFINAAKHGRGGGCELLSGKAHGVVILNAAENRLKVARYVKRHPDPRFDHPGTPDYLDALEDELSHTAARALIHKPPSAKRLGWEVGVRRL